MYTVKLKTFSFKDAYIEIVGDKACDDLVINLKHYSLLEVKSR